MKLICMFLVVALTQLAISSPLGLKGKRIVESKRQQAIDYMVRYGYMNRTKSYNEEQIKQGLKLLQNFFRLPETGFVDEATTELINKPRCGVPDMVEGQPRFVIASKGFDKKHLTYFIERYSPKVPRSEVDESVRLSLEMWGTHAQLTFSQGTRETADILLSFVPRDHNDGFPFYGPHGALAHAFYPTFSGYEGDVHYDEEEDWNVVSPTSPHGYDVFSVTLHELGHSLGLFHSQHPSAVMYPNYQYIDKQRGLDYDDALGIYTIYVLGGQP